MKGQKSRRDWKAMMMSTQKKKKKKKRCGCSTYEATGEFSFAKQVLSFFGKTA